METNIRNKCKAYTSLEQSRKLAEILPLESADMEYILEQWIDEKTHRHKEGYYEIPVVKVDDDYPLQPITHPCWSLAALLDILPHNLKLVLAINDFQGDRKEKYVIGSVEHDKYDCFADNPVDACYEMVLKLNELNLL